MAIDAFLKLDGFKGETTDDKHADEIGVLAWGFGISFIHDSSGPSGRGGRSEFGHLNITKTVDLASPKLYLACAQGAPIEKAVLSLQTSSGSSKMDFLIIEMEDVHVTSISPSGSGDMPMEGLTLSYGTIKWEYAQIDPTSGSKKGSDTTGWNLRDKVKL